MREHTTQTGVTLRIKPIDNRYALQSLMVQAGVFDRMASLGNAPPIDSLQPQEQAKLISAWEQLFSYCAMHGVDENPSQSEARELAAMNLPTFTENITRLSWIRYGHKNGVDILQSAEDVSSFVSSVIAETFEKRPKKE